MLGLSEPVRAKALTNTQAEQLLNIIGTRTSFDATFQEYTEWQSGKKVDARPKQKQLNHLCPAACAAWRIHETQMQQDKLTLATLGQLDGTVGTVVDAAITEALVDCDDWPFLEKARRVTIEVVISSVHDDGRLKSV